MNLKEFFEMVLANLNMGNMVSEPEKITGGWSYP